MYGSLGVVVEVNGDDMIDGIVWKVSGSKSYSVVGIIKDLETV